MKRKYLIMFLVCILLPIAGRTNSYLIDRLKNIFPEISMGYIDANHNKKMDDGENLKTGNPGDAEITEIMDLIVNSVRCKPEIVNVIAAIDDVSRNTEDTEIQDIKKRYMNKLKAVKEQLDSNDAVDLKAAKKKYAKYYTAIDISAYSFNNLKSENIIQRFERPVTLFGIKFDKGTCEMAVNVIGWDVVQTTSWLGTILQDVDIDGTFYKKGTLLEITTKGLPPADPYKDNMNMIEVIAGRTGSKWESLESGAIFVPIPGILSRKTLKGILADSVKFGDIILPAGTIIDNDVYLLTKNVPFLDGTLAKGSRVTKSGEITLGADTVLSKIRYAKGSIIRMLYINEQEVWGGPQGIAVEDLKIYDINVPKGSKITIVDGKVTNIIFSKRTEIHGITFPEIGVLSVSATEVKYILPENMDIKDFYPRIQASLKKGTEIISNKNNSFRVKLNENSTVSIDGLLIQGIPEIVLEDGIMVLSGTIAHNTSIMGRISASDDIETFEVLKGDKVYIKYSILDPGYGFIAIYDSQKFDMIWRSSENKKSVIKNEVKALRSDINQLLAYHSDGKSRTSFQIYQDRIESLYNLYHVCLIIFEDISDEKWAKYESGTEVIKDVNRMYEIRMELYMMKELYKDK